MKDIPFKCEHCGFEMSYTNDQSKPPEEPSWEELIEWPCQQLLGGTGAAIYSNTDGMCKHPLCHPKNNDVIESPPPPAPTEEICPNCHEKAERISLGYMCSKCFYDKL